MAWDHWKHLIEIDFDFDGKSIVSFIEDVLEREEHPHRALEFLTEIGVVIVPVATTTASVEGMFSQLSTIFAPNRQRMGDEYLVSQLLCGGNEDLMRSKVAKDIFQGSNEMDIDSL